MPISISCDCGKRFRIKDELAGKKVRCPACQQVVAVPTIEEASEPTDENDSRADEEASAPSKKKRKKRRKSEMAFPEISLLGTEITGTKVFFLALIAALIGGFGYLLWPGSGVKVIDFHSVEAHVPTPGLRKFNTAEVVLGKKTAVLRIGGPYKVYLFHDSSEGDMYLARLQLSQKFLDKKGALQGGWNLIEPGAIVLESAGEKVPATFLTYDYSDLEEGLQVDLNPPEIIPTRGYNDALEKELKSQGIGGNERREEPSDYLALAQFKGKGGLESKAQRLGSLLTITWNKGSSCWFAEPRIQDLELFSPSSKLDLLCLFRKPKMSGAMTLKVFDQQVAIKIQQSK